MATRLELPENERLDWHHVRTRICMRKLEDYEPDENHSERVEFFDWLLSKESAGFYSWPTKYHFYFSDANTAFEAKIRWG